MFEPQNAVRLSVPMWEAVYKAEIYPGYYGLIAIHDTTRGRALGGCRMAQYTDLGEALTDVLRLSRGMTFKNAIADLPLGGGKSVIVGDPAISGAERETMLEEFGKFLTWVNRDGERYVSAEDMNTTVADIHVVKRFSSNLLGLDVDPSPYTAWGVFSGIAHAVRYFADDLFNGRDTLSGKRVLVQGLGKVGRTLVDYLHEAGAQLFVSDIRESAISAVVDAYPGTQVVAPNELYSVDVDIFAPCAGGEVVTTANIDNLKFKILCGAANNQLESSRLGATLQRRGIAYCPDFIANMGGVCAIQYMEVDKLTHEACLKKIAETVERRLDSTFATAYRENIAFSEAVNHVVKDIVWGQKKYAQCDNAEVFARSFARAEVTI